MKQSIRILSIAAIALSIVACKGKAAIQTTPAVTGTNATVATVNGVTITDAELTESAKDELAQFGMQIYKIKRGKLDTLIETKLIESAAKKDGKSVDDYIKININDKVAMPSEADVKAFYEANKARMGGKSFDEMKDTLTQYLGNQAAQTARAMLISQLKKDSQIAIELEPPRVAVEAGNNPSKGPSSAPVEIIEFTDYQCPFCGRVRPTINQLLEKYKDKIHYTLRDFPLSFHSNAKKAAEAAHCAGEQGKYWEMNTVLFNNQSTLEVAKLKEYAKEVGLNQAKFDKCLDSDKYAKKVDENQAYGASVGVSGTPAFFINGINISGAQPLDNFVVIIDGELAKKN